MFDVNRATRARACPPQDPCLSPFVVHESEPQFGPALNWIGGEWRRGSRGAAPVLDPRTGGAIGTHALSGAEDLEAAGLAAASAHEGWRRVPIRERAQVLFRLKALLERDLEELTGIVSIENGKTPAEAEACVFRAIECVETGASLPAIASGQELEVATGVRCRSSYEPLGVVAGITPFNFPLMVPLWMLPQALLAGNSFLLKPSDHTPYSANKLASLLREAGLPDGVFNIVHGGIESAQELVAHRGVAALGFIGSTPVAAAVYGAVTLRGARALCLGGANNHLIVAPDADVESAASAIVASAFGCAGQRCMAGSVVVRVGGEGPELTDAILRKAAALSLGPDLGPMVSAAGRDAVLAAIEEAANAGAKVLLDGRASLPEGGGFWLGPTVLDEVEGSDVPKREVFGPLLSLRSVPDLDAAIAMENQSEHGNAATIFTNSGRTAQRCIDGFEAGMCGVNVGVPVPREPYGFGGWNQSKFGHGDMTGADGFRFWTRARKVTMRWPS